MIEMVEKITEDKIRKRIDGLLENGFTDRTDIYSKLVEEFGTPRPTISRIVRDYREEMKKKLAVLESNIEFLLNKKEGVNNN